MKQAELRRWTRHEDERLIDHSFLDEDDPIELLDGLWLVKESQHSGLSFLGLGTQPPTADWGSMLATGRQFVILSPHVVLLPGLAIFAAVLALNLAGDALRDLLDPRAHAR